VDLPHGVRARLSGDHLRFEPREQGTSAAFTSAPDEVSLPVPGQVRFGAWQLTAAVLEPGVGAEPSLHCAVLDWRDAAAGLSVRSRRPGDRMTPAGMDAAKKLQDLFV